MTIFTSSRRKNHVSNAEKFLDLPLEDVIGDRFGKYSKYIIQERALPDVRDGLKPVQRRILYAMYRDGNHADKPFRKAAKTVGNVIGNYHPHGDSSVYEAMVRMSQPWKGRFPLIEMHGNNGSIDGDPPAAMRYTEARLSAISSQLLKDIEKETVEHIPNFDDTEKEPVVLPAQFPNLLVNGATGISAGYATDIPPHQIGEVIDATLMRIDRPNCTVDELMTVLQGPDFPTGGIIQGIDGIKKGYETGKGKIVLRAATKIENIRGGRKQIVITEIPYDVTKANIVKKIDEIRFDKKVEGIAEVRDETDRSGLRIVIELKRDADPKGILTYLFKTTDLQTSYHFNMVAIYEKTPKLLSLTEILDAYIAHQKEVVLNRSRYELNKAKARHHIVEGLIYAISILDDVIQIIRQSKNKRDAKDNLMSAFSFTEEQAEAIVTLQLYRLTNTDVVTLEEELASLLKEIERLEGILQSEKKLLQVIKKQLKQVKKQYNDERRTKIEAKIEALEVDLHVVAPSEDVIVSVTREGYVKRTSLRSYSASNEEEPSMKQTDDLLFAKELHTTDILLFFTKKGRYVYVPVYELPDIRWKDSGQHIGNIISLSADDTIVNVIHVPEFTNERYFLFFTKNGIVKKTAVSSYEAKRHMRALMALHLKDEGDEVIHVAQTDGNQHIFVGTHHGYALLFHENEVNPVGPRAAGVKGINLKKEDFVVSGFVTNHIDEDKVMITTQRGALKKMALSALDIGKRNTRGVLVLRQLKKDPHRLIGVHLVNNDTKWIRFRTEKDEIVNETITNYKEKDRFSNGSFVFDVQDKGKVVDSWLRLPFDSLSK